MLGVECACWLLLLVTGQVACHAPLAAVQAQHLARNYLTRIPSPLTMPRFLRHCVPLSLPPFSSHAQGESALGYAKAWQRVNGMELSALANGETLHMGDAMVVDMQQVASSLLALDAEYGTVFAHGVRRLDN